MIKSIADTPTRQFIETGKSRFSGLDPAKAMARLNVLNAARSLDDISPFALDRASQIDRRPQGPMGNDDQWTVAPLFSF